MKAKPSKRPVLRPTTRASGPLTAPIRKQRFFWVAIAFCLWTAAIAFRLTWLQVIKHDHFVKMAARQQQRGFEVAPRRGVLYDRNLRELAMTVLVPSIYAVPTEIGDNREADAHLLAVAAATGGQEQQGQQQGGQAQRSGEGEAGAMGHRGLYGAEMEWPMIA